MPLFVQSLPLSLKAFWRYLLLLPFLAVAAFLLLFASLIPIVGFLVPSAISAWLVLIGARCALNARGHSEMLDLSRLFMVSVGLGALFLATDLLTEAGSMGIAWILVQTGFELDPLGILVGSMGFTYYWTGLFLLLISPALIGAALFAAPLVSAAASTSQRSTGPDMFLGIGTGFVSLFIVGAASVLVGFIYSFFGEVWTAFGLLTSALWAWSAGEEIPWDTTLSPYSALRSTLLMAWTTSWFYATAVLARERAMEKHSLGQAIQREESRPAAEDLRALRMERM